MFEVGNERDIKSSSNKKDAGRILCDIIQDEKSANTDVSILKICLTCFVYFVNYMIILLWWVPIFFSWLKIKMKRKE